MRRIVHPRALAAALAACACVLGSTAAARAADPEIQIALPAPEGRHVVGTKELELVDRSRRDTPGMSGPRRLMVQVTYPMNVDDSGRVACHPARYISPLVQPVLMEAVGVDRSIGIDTGTCRGGSIAGGKRPVLVFSHAFTADRFVYASLINDLASRGYVVLAPDHPPDAFAVQYPAGELVEGEYGRPLAPADVSAEEIASLDALRTDDVRFVLTRALRLAARDSGFLAGHLDGKRVGALGHSLGGSTATHAAAVDRRFDAAVDIDGSLFGGWATKTGSRTPFMLLAAEGGVGESFAQQPLCDYMAGLRGPRFALSLADALHFSFSDFQALAPEIAQAYPEWAFAGLYQAVVGTIDPDASIAAQRHELAAFFARYVKGKKGSQGPTPSGGFSELPDACAS